MQIMHGGTARHGMPSLEILNPSVFHTNMSVHMLPCFNLKEPPHIHAHLNANAHVRLHLVRTGSCLQPMLRAQPEQLPEWSLIALYLAELK